MFCIVGCNQRLDTALGRAMAEDTMIDEVLQEIKRHQPFRCFSPMNLPSQVVMINIHRFLATEDVNG